MEHFVLSLIVQRNCTSREKQSKETIKANQNLLTNYTLSTTKTENIQDKRAHHLNHLVQSQPPRQNSTEFRPTEVTNQKHQPSCQPNYNCLHNFNSKVFQTQHPENLNQFLEDSKVEKGLSSLTNSANRTTKSGFVENKHKQRIYENPDNGQIQLDVKMRFNSPQNLISQKVDISTNRCISPQTRCLKNLKQTQDDLETALGIQNPKNIIDQQSQSSSSTQPSQVTRNSQRQLSPQINFLDNLVIVRDEVQKNHFITTPYNRTESPRVNLNQYGCYSTRQLVQPQMFENGIQSQKTSYNLNKTNSRKENV